MDRYEIYYCEIIKKTHQEAYYVAKEGRKAGFKIRIIKLSSCFGLFINDEPITF